MLYSSAINMMAMLCSFEMYLRIITARNNTILLTTELTERKQTAVKYPRGTHNTHFQQRSILNLYMMNVLT
jgi:hypothetical protein